MMNVGLRVRRRWSSQLDSRSTKLGDVGCILCLDDDASEASLISPTTGATNEADMRLA